MSPLDVVSPVSPERVSVVSDDASWGESVLEICDTLGVLGRRYAWAQAQDAPVILHAIVAEIPLFTSDILETLRLWASRALQPMTILCVGSEPGQVAQLQQVRELGFGHMVEARKRRVDSTWIRGELRGMLERGAWLVPQVASALRCHDAAVVRALEAALQLIPRHHTVAFWAFLLDLHHRQALHELFAERGLPPPKDVLDHLRLARVALFAARTTPKPNRNAIAARFGYSSGDYLGKCAKRRLGITLGELLEIGPLAAVACLASSCDERRVLHV